MKKRYLIIPLILGLLFGDRIISEIVFQYQCSFNKGSFVYQEVILDDSYIIPIPEDVALRYYPFEISELEMLDRKRIEKDYKIIYLEFKNLTMIGPVQSSTSKIIRRYDNEVMGEVITFRSNYGWLVRNFPFLGVTLHKNCSTPDTKTLIQYHKQIFTDVFQLEKNI